MYLWTEIGAGMPIGSEVGGGVTDPPFVERPYRKWTSQVFHPLARDLPHSIAKASARASNHTLLSLDRREATLLHVYNSRTLYPFRPYRIPSRLPIMAQQPKKSRPIKATALLDEIQERLHA